jgi:sugar O-acyltransferase (sialic acid O-acetyltransferase NeuD family)
MNKKILLIGGGVHCKSVLDSLLELNEYEKIGIIDKKENVNNIVMGISVIGCDDDLQSLFNDGYKYAFISVGSVGNPSLRIKLFHLLCEIGYELPTIIDASAKVSQYAKIEQGVFIGKQCIVNVDSYIQTCAIINSGAIIEHDCQIGAFAHVSPGAVLGGEVFVGNNSHIGSNVTIRQQIRIGTDSIIGMGSVVIQNVNANVVAYGNPCEEVREL